MNYNLYYVKYKHDDGEGVKTEFIEATGYWVDMANGATIQFKEGGTPFRCIGGVLDFREATEEECDNYYGEDEEIAD